MRAGCHDSPTPPLGRRPAVHGCGPRPDVAGGPASRGPGTGNDDACGRGSTCRHRQPRRWPGALYRLAPAVCGSRQRHAGALGPAEVPRRPRAVPLRPQPDDLWCAVPADWPSAGTAVMAAWTVGAALSDHQSGVHSGFRGTAARAAIRRVVPGITVSTSAGSSPARVPGTRPATVSATDCASPATRVTFASTASRIGVICRSCRMRITRFQARSNFFQPAA